MEFHFNTPEERLAITAVDADIYPHLGIHNTSPYSKGEFKRYADGIKAIRQYPGALPLIADDLQTYVDELEDLSGHWSIVWFQGASNERDVVFGDGFRLVVTLGGADFMIRPPNNAICTEPRRLFLGPGDVQACLKAATNMIRNANNVPPTAAVTGQGLATEGHRNLPILPIPFEWKIAHAPTHRLAERVPRWRYKACGNKHEYNARKKEYLRRSALHPPVVQPALPAMPVTGFNGFQHQGTTAVSLGRGSNSTSYLPPTPAAPSTGSHVSDSGVSQPGPAAGRGRTSLPYQGGLGMTPPSQNHQYGDFRTYQPGPSGGN